jgi:hypothetical protein
MVEFCQQDGRGIYGTDHNEDSKGPEKACGWSEIIDLIM